MTKAAKFAKDESRRHDCVTMLGDYGRGGGRARALRNVDAH